MLFIHFLRHVCLLIKANEKKVSEKCFRMVEILIDAIIKKEMDEKVDVYETQTRSDYIKLRN